MSPTCGEFFRDFIEEKESLRALGTIYGFQYVDFGVENRGRRTNVVTVEIKFKNNPALQYFYRIIMQGHNEDFTNVKYPNDSAIACDLTTNLVSRLWDINESDGFFLPVVDPTLIDKYGGVSTLIFYIHDLLEQAVIDIESSVIVEPDES